MTNGMRWTQEQVDALQRRNAKPATINRTQPAWKQAFQEAAKNLVNSAQAPAKKRSKYRNKQTVVNGINFASAAEARRYGELKLLEQSGQIKNLRRQVRYALCHSDGEVIELYIADAVYEESGQRRVEDVKSEATRNLASFKRKKAWMASAHGIEIREVMA